MFTLKGDKTYIMKQLFLIFGFLSLIMSQACEKDMDIDEEIDTIEIISVSPSSILVDGVEYNFIVEIEYELVTVNSGMVMIGFNTVEVGKFYMLSEATEIVSKGSGVHTFDVTTIAKDWMSEGDFQVYVNLSENPHPSTWAPLATDVMVLNFEN